MPGRSGEPAALGTAGLSLAVSQPHGHADQERLLWLPCRERSEWSDWRTALDDDANAIQKCITKPGLNITDQLEGLWRKAMGANYEKSLALLMGPQPEGLPGNQATAVLWQLDPGSEGLLSQAGAVEVQTQAQGLSFLCGIPQSKRHRPAIGIGSSVDDIQIAANDPGFWPLLDLKRDAQTTVTASAREPLPAEDLDMGGISW